MITGVSVKYSRFPIILVGICAFALLKADPVRILPLGNSITQANNTHLSYRYPLWKKLIDDNLSFDYVGSMINNKNGNPVWPDYNGHMFDQNHDGHWGWRTDQILDGHPSVPGEFYLSYWLQSYTPDIALIHLGSNDMIQYQTVESTIIELEDVIGTLRNDNPEIIILLAQLIPTTLPANSLITQLNSMIPGIAVEFSEPSSPIYIVDQNSGFDAVTDTYDGVHPNESGEEKMAQQWRDAIIEALHPVVNLRVLLEGPFFGNVMNSSNSAYLPLYQPYFSEPWNYTGTESLVEVPEGAVDWILVELRDTTAVDLADETCIIARKACLIDSSGYVRDSFGSMDLDFEAFVTDSIFIVVHHRNHLAVISSIALIRSEGKFAYDFTIGETQAYGAASALKNVGSGQYAMISGDSNQDGTVNTDDLDTVWKIQSGMMGYLSSDFNLDFEVDNRDKNDFCRSNLGASGMVP